MIFIAEVIATMLLVTTLYVFLIAVPLMLLSRWSRLLVYHLTLKRVCWFLRDEQIALGIGLPPGHPDSYFDSDLRVRSRADRANRETAGSF